jgi:hypothetical protein
MSSLERNLSASDQHRALESARAELAEREERVALLQAIRDAESAARWLRRTSNVPEAVERLEAEQREVAYLQVAVRGLEAALTGREA